MLNLEYLTNEEGNKIDIWRKLLPTEDTSIYELTEAIEDYCLNKAMDESINTPLLDRNQALAYLKEE